MGKTGSLEAVWNTGKGKFLLLWFGLDAALYLGALLSLALAITDAALRPVTYGFTIALVTSWALRMAWGIWLELRRVRQCQQEKNRKLHELLQKHGLSAEAMTTLEKEIKALGS